MLDPEINISVTVEYDDGEDTKTFSESTSSFEIAAAAVDRLERILKKYRDNLETKRQMLREEEEEEKREAAEIQNTTTQ